jgi:hypothetical protein
VAKTESETIISNVDKELHARQRQLLLRSVAGLTHMIDDHSANADAVFQAFSDATDFDDLFGRLDKCMDGGACGAAKDMLISSQNEVNSVRLALGLKPFEKKDLGDFEFHHGRIHEIRDRRLREMRAERERETKGRKSEKDGGQESKP